MPHKIAVLFKSSSHCGIRSLQFIALRRLLHSASSSYLFIDFSVINGEDVLISFMTLFGLTGFGTMLATTVSGAIRIITTENFRPELMLNIIEKYKV